MASRRTMQGMATPSCKSSACTWSGWTSSRCSVSAAPHVSRVQTFTNGLPPLAQAIQNGEAPPAAGNSLGRFSSGASSRAQRSGSVDPEAAATPAQQVVSSDATSTSLAILTPTTELLRIVNRVQSIAAERAQGQQLIQQQAASLQLPIWPPVPIMPDASFAHPTPQPLDGHQSGQLLQPSAGMQTIRRLMQSRHTRS